MQMADELVHALLDLIESHVGPNPQVKLFTGEKPLSCALPDSGTLLASLTPGADWMGPAANGQKSKNGTWAGVGAASGPCGYLRIYTASGVCKIQGTVSGAGQGGEIVPTSGTNIVTESQPVAIDALSFDMQSLIEGN